MFWAINDLMLLQDFSYFWHTCLTVYTPDLPFRNNILLKPYFVSVFSREYYAYHFFNFWKSGIGEWEGVTALLLLCSQDVSSSDLPCGICITQISERKYKIMFRYEWKIPYMEGSLYNIMTESERWIKSKLYVVFLYSGLN